MNENMNETDGIVIDLDDLMNDAETLGKLYECGSLMIQSSNQEKARQGYRILDVVDKYMRDDGHKKHLNMP